MQTVLVAALIFAVVSSPMMYKLTNTVLGRFYPLADEAGAPTYAGLLVHTIVFAIILHLSR